MSYWTKNGLYQSDYNQLHKKLVPAKGQAHEAHGELLRIVGNMYKRFHNDGDKTLDALLENTNAQGYKPLSRFPTEIKAFFKRKKVTSEILEAVMNKTVQYAKKIEDNYDQMGARPYVAPKPAKTGKKCGTKAKNPKYSRDELVAIAKQRGVTLSVQGQRKTMDELCKELGIKLT